MVGRNRDSSSSTYARKYLEQLYLSQYLRHQLKAAATEPHQAVEAAVAATVVEQEVKVAAAMRELGVQHSEPQQHSTHRAVVPVASVQQRTRSPPYPSGCRRRGHQPGARERQRYTLQGPQPRNSRTGLRRLHPSSGRNKFSRDANIFPSFNPCPRKIFLGIGIDGMKGIDVYLQGMAIINQTFPCARSQHRNGHPGFCNRQRGRLRGDRGGEPISQSLNTVLQCD